MDLKLPNLGEGADSGTVVNLFVKEGDQVKKDQPILELENEKAVATIPSTTDGVIAKIFVKTGDKISVGQSILSLTDSQADRTGAPEPKEAPPEPTPRVQSEKIETEAEEPAAGSAPALEPKPGVAPAAAPSIRKLAADLGIDLARVRGSERGGRIVLADLRSYIQRLQSSAAQKKAVASAPSAQPIDFSKWGPTSKKPLSPLRQVIARRMSESWAAVPRVTQFDQADVTALMNLRKKYAE